MAQVQPRESRAHAYLRCCLRQWSRGPHFTRGSRFDALAAHLHAEAGVAFLEELVVIRTSFRAACDSSESPSVQLAGEARKLRMLEIFWHDLRSKLFFLINNEPLAMRKPCYNFRIILFGKYFHQPLRERHGNILLRTRTDSGNSGAGSGAGIISYPFLCMTFPLTAIFTGVELPRIAYRCVLAIRGCRWLGRAFRLLLTGFRCRMVSQACQG